MAYRIFRDSQGAEWQAWDVVPRLEERRANDRRGRVAEPMQTERRGRLDRRILARTRSVLTSGMGSGWLCFAADVEKRRLTPIPDGWEHCPSAQLERYCAEATPVRRVTTETHVPDMRK